MKKILLTLAVLVPLMLGGAYHYLKGKRYDVVISQEQIDEGLAQKFPFTKEHLVIFSITYSNPEVTLLENEDRIQVGLDATLNIRINNEKRNLGGGATVISGLRYAPVTQEFFLDDAEITRFEINGIPDQFLEQVTGFASKAAREYIESKPIYQLEAKDFKTATAKLLLKDLKVRDQTIHVSLGL